MKYAVSLFVGFVSTLLGAIEPPERIYMTNYFNVSCVGYDDSRCIGDGTYKVDIYQDGKHVEMQGWHNGVLIVHALYDTTNLYEIITTYNDLGTDPQTSTTKISRVGLYEDILNRESAWGD